ncbi:hypothetical protein ACIPY5_12035 [Microbacterium sp. NPDC089698]|uniref:hypothetical protein n=1 Tax=Microbacterium sp. NPDC089698 TaxID=3364200 RepID=UPI0037FAE175
MNGAIQDWLEGVSVWEVLVTVGVVTTVVLALWKLIPLFKKLSNFIDDVAGEEARAGVPARAGLMERVQRIEHELFPNSGGSARDAINRTEAAVVSINKKLNNDQKRIDRLDQIAARHHPEERP